jgi:cell division protein FtsB
MKKIKALIQRLPFIKFLGNRYVLVLFIFLIWMLFLDNNSQIEHHVLNKEINELEDNIDYYQKEIKSDSIKIKKLKNVDEIEKYAREKYYMKKENEDIYIIEYENDTLIEEQKN